MDYFKKHKEGLILTIVFHLILLLILFNFGFFTPLPLPQEKGVLIDFGVTDMGMGEIEPAPAPVKAQPTPVPAAAKPTPSKPIIPANAEIEEVMTQDFEKTAAIEAGKKKKLEDDQKRKEIQEKERQRRDSLQQVENTRQIEFKRVAELRRKDSLQRVQEDAQKSAINSRAQNAFSGSTGQGTTTSSGQGTTYQPGNQGSTSGTAGANNYGIGGGGPGVSFNLSGRSAVSLPKPLFPGTEEGTVVVEIKVDKFGKVTSAVPGAKGSTTTDVKLQTAAKNAALSTKFNQNMDVALQTGYITYRFVLD